MHEDWLDDSGQPMPAPGVAEDEYIRLNLERGLIGMHRFQGFYLVAVRYPAQDEMDVRIVSQAMNPYTQAVLAGMSKLVEAYFADRGGQVVSHNETVLRPLTPEEKGQPDG